MILHTINHTTMPSIHFTNNSTGLDLKNYIKPDNCKYKLSILSKPYNSRSAYYPFENTYINIGDNIYNVLTQDGLLKTLYAAYYNTKKEAVEKTQFNMPVTISADDIDSIIIYVLPENYTDYYM